MVVVDTRIGVDVKQLWSIERINLIEKLKLESSSEHVKNDGYLNDV